MERRLKRFGEARDGTDVWTALGIAEPAEIPGLGTDEFLRHAASKRETADDAR